MATAALTEWGHGMVGAQAKAKQPQKRIIGQVTAACNGGKTNVEIDEQFQILFLNCRQAASGFVGGRAFWPQNVRWKEFASILIPQRTPSCVSKSRNSFSAQTNPSLFLDGRRRI